MILIYEAYREDEKEVLDVAEPERVPGACLLSDIVAIERVPVFQRSYTHVEEVYLWLSTAYRIAIIANYDNVFAMWMNYLRLGSLTARTIAAN